MKVLIALWRFAGLTGSELHAYELARALVGRGHRVTVAAPELGGEIRSRAAEFASLTPLDSARALGPYDVVLANQPRITELVARLGFPVVQTVHGLLSLEDPVVSDRVRAYVAVRPAVLDRLPQAVRSRSHVIFNPVDLDRFRDTGGTPGQSVLFAGTYDHLRRDALDWTLRRAREEGLSVHFVGTPHPQPVPGLTAEPARWDMETAINGSVAVAGRIFGRSSIEGWACGRTSWSHTTELDGKVLGQFDFAPPAPDLMRLFDARLVAAQYEQLAESVI